MATQATNLGVGRRVTPAGRNPSAEGFYIRHDLPSASYFMTVPPEALVTEVATAVHEAFNATSPALSAGDPAAAAGFLVTADVPLTTVGAVGSSKTGGESYAAGRYYPTGGTIQFNWTRGTPAATPTGLLAILVSFSVMSNWNGTRNVGS